MADARNTSLRVLNKLERGNQTLDGILDHMPHGKDYLSKRDRALFNALTYGVLRWRGRLDYIISHFSNAPIQKIEPPILNILRLGLFQIVYLDRIPNSAAVNTAVELSKQAGFSRAAGFVNALLRKAALNFRIISLPAFEADPVAFLSADQSLPEWLAHRWLNRFNQEALMALCHTINSIPPLTIRTNTLKTTRQQLTLSLEQTVERIEPTTHAPDGLRLVDPGLPLNEIPAFKKDWFQVQDEAAQLVSLLLDPQPGESVLDACAGLGGKTGHIAQLMQNKGRITAMDKDERKLQKLDLEMRRLGVSIAQRSCQDLNALPGANRHALFDRLLLDAPCSGLGVLRRNPDIKWNSTEESLRRHAERQKRFLDNLAFSVKPGGILVYAVCSIEPEENEAVVEDFLKKHPEFAIDSNRGILPESVASLFESATWIKTLPLLDNMDGFFLARLKRIK
ncbi:MAG: 16S rRNA (cytosine(967)-C(5))-methyltransferase RsmB [Deltaproteobacteria bacterium]|jgi:16S rRNA (cytosine967-C5)-methyltransferase|nr:16S rRNA (cytosine(967)-C(5))-methyltransferase RsmB [Deltaproteobacteria bacterium]